MPPRQNTPFSSLADPNSILGPNFLRKVGSAATSLAPKVTSLVGRITNPIGAFASDFGAARRSVAGTRLIGRREPAQEVATAPTPVLPSGTPMTGFDIYPTTPQMAPSFPTRTAATAQAQPTAAPSVPQFPTIGMGLMGNANIRPLPTEQISPMTSISRIEGGPASMNINAPVTAEAQGRQAIQTPYGTIYATAQQASSFGSRPTAYEGRTPAEQQALLAQMRVQGSKIARNIASGNNSQMNNRVGSSNAVLASTGFGAMQNQQANRVPPPIRTPSLYGGMGYASTLGGPQPATSRLATGPINEENRSRIFGTV